MGFKIGRTFELKFEGTGLNGAIIDIRSASVGTILEMTTCSIEREFEILSDHLISWNFESDNGPIPVTIEGIRELEEPVKNLIITEWMKATRGVTAPLDMRSQNGEQSEVPSMQTEPL